MEILFSRVAGIDVHKRQVTVAVRAPDSESSGGEARIQRVRRFATFYGALLEMAEWLRAERVTHVAMEATGVYWRPVFHALAEFDGFEIVLCNARHVKNVPGRKTDANDAVWLAQLCEVGLLRGSFIPPADIAAIRELTRYRRKLTEERTRETQRLHKVLEDGGIKLDSVASDSLGVSGRAMITALIAGERDPAVLADLARGLLRKKIPDLTMALAGRFAAHHAVLAGLHLDHIDQLNVMIGRLEARIEEAVTPFARHRDLLMTIPGIGVRAAQTIIAEIGVDMSRFPTADHLASWAGLCPGNNESAGKRKKTATRNGNPQLCAVLVEAAWAVARTQTRLGARFRRLHRRFGKSGGKKAAVAIAHTILVIVWHVLHDEVDYIDLGTDYYTRRDEPEARKRLLQRQLEELGYHVEISPAA
ncbi:IS110 family transposase [Antrihabitans cavernicola]|uniref:IS110 family transposase n=1 Tax=Antrihabitans cavernicola TaxID=2495913 RepID=A0A5A7S5X4_9NOCA|nr:IS110 family transposase [Spelaeibacter cavernicola]KAA0015717.1 IS110 family transposase [Spelaeibacter cavernicola]